MAHYIAYYENQVGSGGGIEHFYHGSPYQRGHGIGSFLGGLFRKALPILTSGLKAVGKEALRSGVQVLDDVAGQNMDLKDSLKMRLGESANNLRQQARKRINHLMEGDGYKILVHKRLPQSQPARGRRRTLKSTNTKRKKKKKNTKKKKKVQNKIKKRGSRSVYDIFKQ